MRSNDGKGAGGIYLYAGRAELENTILAGNIDGEACKGFNPDTDDDTVINCASTSPGAISCNGLAAGGFFGEFVSTFAPDAYLNQLDCSEDGDISDDSAPAPLVSKECFFWIPTSLGSNGFNIIGNPSGFTFVATTGDQVGTEANPLDPLLGPLQDNGGSTFTHAPEIGSPAIDAGGFIGATLRVAAGCSGVDQTGNPRPQAGTPTGAAQCDIGAVEAKFDFGCTNSELAPTQLTMDGGLGQLQKLVKKATRAFRKAGGSRKKARSYNTSASELYLAGWTATWVDLPGNVLQCGGNVGNLCVSASTSSATTGYIDSSDQLRALVGKVSKKTRKLGGKSGKKLKKKAKNQHATNISTAAAIPAETLVC
ncbi:MAG: choice-of-anchor Q domain-containing protein [Bdellovibrionota bacterium]